VLSALDAIDLVDPDVGAHGRAPLQVDNEAHSLDSLAGGVFVGRQREMGDLKAALEEALSGRGRLLTLVGEPGIGKSRTAQELATYDGLRHSQVLWGRCYEGEGAPPYWPWVQAIRSYVRDKDPDDLRSEMGAGAADIAGIVSDVSEKLTDLAAPPELEPEQARFRLFDSMTTFLKTASQRQPLVLVLDDLHWADHPSLLLLEFVARELDHSRVLVIGTYRDMELSRRHPLSLTLGELNRERLFQRVLLRGLSQEDVGRFIELVSGLTPPQGMVKAVHRQTEGNPLFVTEVVRLLVQEGELTPEKAAQRDSWSVRIPEGVRDVIGRRLDRLSERCNETLTIASVIGREFALSHVLPLTDDLTEDRLLEVLEEALFARVIEELPSSVGRYQFTHALIQETLAGELSTTRKVRLHARIAETLERYYEDDADANAAELVYHFSEAEAVLGTDRLAHYSVIAGERALSAHAWEEAQDHFQRALAVKDAHKADSETAALQVGLGRAQVAMGLIVEGEANLSRAFDLYVESGDPVHAVAIVDHPYAMPLLRLLPGLISHALELVTPESLQAGRVLCNHGICLGTTRNGYLAAQEAFGRALAIARWEHDESLEMRVLSSSANIDGMHLRWTESLDKSLQAIELASLVDEPVFKIRGHFWAGNALLCGLGDVAGARSQFSQMLTDAEQLRDNTWIPQGLLLQISTFSLVGDWENAFEHSDRCITRFPDDVGALAQRSLMEYELGNPSQGQHYLERHLQAIQVREDFHGLLNVAFINLTDQFTGLEHLEETRERAQAMLSPSQNYPVAQAAARFALGLFAVHSGDGPQASEHYEYLVPYRGSVLWHVDRVVDRLLGLLSHTMGELEQATAHFEDALAFCRKAGFRPELAWTCCDYADALRERDGEGDRAKAISLLDESLAISSKLGMRPLMERVLSRREILKA